MSKGAEVGSRWREKWLDFKADKKSGYILLGFAAFIVTMASRTAAYSFTSAARLMMTAIYLHRAITYKDQNDYDGTR